MDQPSALPPIKRQIKDSVFTDLFGTPAYLLQLYQELHPEDTTATVDDLTTVTLQNVLVDAQYNDLGFTVGDRLVILVEAQSTWTPNIAIRAFLYLAKTLDGWLREHECNLYASSRVAFPMPELYVVYTGDALEVPAAVSIADDFFPGAACAVDLRVQVLRGGSGILGEYVEFTKIANEQVREHGRTNEAVQQTIRICLERNVLAAYLESRQQEVHDIMITLYDEQEVFDRYVKSYGAEKLKEGRQEGRKEGRQEGALKARLESIRSLMQSLGMTASAAMDALGITGDERARCARELSK